MWVMGSSMWELCRSPSSPKTPLAAKSLARPCHLNLLPDHEEVVPEDFPYTPALLNHADVARPLLFRSQAVAPRSRRRSSLHLRAARRRTAPSPKDQGKGRFCKIYT